MEDLEAQEFDLVVLGGGILGACVARDAALRGLSCALLERDDFASVTSCNSLKIVHGGLRQLQRLDVPGMRLSVAERATWLRVAPHLVSPMPVVVPLFGGALEQAAFRSALAVTDLLSLDRNRGLPSERYIPGGRGLSRAECIERLPEFEAAGVRGGVLFYDALMHSSERLVLETVLGAARAGAVVANRAECTGPLRQDGARVGVRVRDRESGAELAVRARAIVNTAGPAGVALEARLLGMEARPSHGYSIAWNLVLRGLGHEVAFAPPGRGETPTGKGAGSRPRRLFVVPWRDRTLVGTGHAHFDGDPAAFEGLSTEHPAVRAFLDEFNRAWPGRPIGEEDVLHVHGGLLPAAPAAGEEVRLLTKPVIRSHRGGGCPVVSATTVKFTTARAVAERAVDRACQLLGHSAPCVTASTPLPGAPLSTVGSLLERARSALSAELGSATIEHLVCSHGARHEEVLATRDGDPSWAEAVDPESPVIRAEIVHAVRAEMAGSVDDILMRRTELGARGPLPETTVARVEEIFNEARSAAGSAP